MRGCDATQAPEPRPPHLGSGSCPGEQEPLTPRQMSSGKIPLTTGAHFPHPPSYRESGRCGALGQESSYHLPHALPARTPPTPAQGLALSPLPNGTTVPVFLPRKLDLRMRPSPKHRLLRSPGPEGLGERFQEEMEGMDG